MSTNKIKLSYNKLKSYCENENFMGYDPYDGLNSKLLKSFPLLKNNRIIRLIWIQFFKKCPFNFRKIFLIQKEYNPKGLGLFLSHYCNQYKINHDPECLRNINFFIEKIMSFRSKEYKNDSWGYNFDWQSRAFYLPKFTPTIVTTSFISNSLLDAYDILKDRKLLESARRSCDFIIKDLNKVINDKEDLSFSYSPFDEKIVYNASILGAKLLSRVAFITNESHLFDVAKKAVHFVCKNQNVDGSWFYGKSTYHQWIDNFHTGYILECISDYMKYSKDSSYQFNLQKGFKYYLDHLFTSNGIPKYYNNSLYPIDLHSFAQFIITLQTLDKLNQYKNRIDSMIHWAIDYMQNKKKGFFYYQKRKNFTVRIPYMRWTQAWMLLSLGIYNNHFEKNNNYEMSKDSYQNTENDYSGHNM